MAGDGRAIELGEQRLLPSQGIGLQRVRPEPKAAPLEKVRDPSGDLGHHARKADL